MPLATAPELVEVAPTSKLESGNRAGEFLLIGILVSASIAAIGLSWRWPLVGDGAILQYGAFLMGQGKVPYRDIFDMNGLGAYFSSWLAIHLFGYSDLGWRLYDLLFLLLGSLGIAFICKPFGRLATILGSCLLILTHILLGPREIGERDFQMGSLELLSAGFMLQGFRDGKRGWFLASGVMAFLGGAIKPTGFLFLAVFTLQVVVVSFMQKGKEKEGRLPWPLWMLLGAALPCLLAGAYLLWNGAWWSFLEVCKKLIPLHASIRRRPWSFLWPILETHMEALRLLVVCSGLLFVCKIRTWLARESAAVVLGVACGFASYWIQAKGFAYHLAPLTAFLGVWCGLAIATLFKDDRTLVRAPLAFALAFWILHWVPGFVSVPADFRRGYLPSWEITELHQLETQISHLRAEGKDKGIQIMDSNLGGAHALYDLRLVQCSEFIYDTYFYNPPNNPFVADLRARFLREMAATRPDMLIVSSQSWPYSEIRYKRMEEWPELKNFLQSDYDLKAELSDYKIYVHR